MRPVSTFFTTLALLLSMSTGAVAQAVNIERANSSGFFGVRGLTERAFVYSDRDYVFSGVHGCLLGRPYLVTPNQDKFSRAPELVVVNANPAVTVFVGYDTRYPTRPDWLWQGYDPAPFVMTAVNPRTNQAIVTFQMYRARAPQRRIRLGGNIAAKENNNFGMYAAFFVDANHDSCPR